MGADIPFYVLSVVLCRNNGINDREGPLGSEGELDRNIDVGR
jgi:hypothetical protein